MDAKELRRILFLKHSPADFGVIPGTEQEIKRIPTGEGFPGTPGGFRFDADWRPPQGAGGTARVRMRVTFDLEYETRVAVSVEAVGSRERYTQRSESLPTADLSDKAFGFLRDLIG